LNNISEEQPAPLILLPGLGTDGRMFSSLKNRLPQIVTPEWIEPMRGESLVEYARRFAPVIDPGRPCFIGGASFGGVMAQEVAAVLPHVQKCFVIGSIRSPESHPWRLRMLLPITPLVGILPLVSPLVVSTLGSWLRPPTRGVLTQLAAADAKFLRWAAHAVLTWKPSSELAAVPVYHIHGDRDRVFPSKLNTPHRLVSGAGHLISITHSDEIVDVLREQMAAA
jgi:pimeloyl-ACP methyl ester carboxylesterase